MSKHRHPEQTLVIMSKHRHPELVSGSKKHDAFRIHKQKINYNKYMKNSYTYIMTNKLKGTLYIGVTSNLVKRVYEHKNSVIDGFTSNYNIKILIYYEVFDDITSAIRREKQLKNWHRDWKINLIESVNPIWNDLYESII